MGIIASVVYAGHARNNVHGKENMVVSNLSASGSYLSSWQKFVALKVCVCGVVRSYLRLFSCLFALFRFSCVSPVSFVIEGDFVSLERPHVLAEKTGSRWRRRENERASSVAQCMAWRGCSCGGGGNMLERARRMGAEQAFTLPGISIK